jgi:GNAT superfamily N-acetyltransferase
MNPEYSVRPYMLEDRPSLEELYRAVYGEVWRDKSNLEWTIDRPLKEGGAIVVMQNGTVASAQPYCDMELHTPWGPDRATLFMDLATHPDHRRRGLFRRVVIAARDAAFQRGASIILTTPNRISSHGFQMMPDWRRLCGLDCLIFPLGSGDCIQDSGLISGLARLALAAGALFCGRSIKPEKDTNVLWSPGIDADELWERASKEGDILVKRDRAFLEWRFRSNYQLFLARDSRRPAAYAAVRVVSRAGLKVGMVMDCVAADDGESAVRLMRSVMARLKEQGVSIAAGFFLRGSSFWNWARRAGFMRLPRFFSPRDYPVYVSVRPGNRHGDDLLNSTLWQFSLADSDLV